MASTGTVSRRPVLARPKHLGVVIGGLAGLVATVAVGTMLDGPETALLVATGLVALVALVAACGVAASITALALFCVAPGVLGEQSLVLSGMALIAVLVAFVASKHDSQSPSLPARVAMLSAPLLVGAALVLMGSAVENAALYVIVSAVIIAAFTRRGLVRRVLRALAIAVIASTISYAATLAIGFGAGTKLALESRTVALHPPFTLSTGGFNYIPDAPRMSLGVGEPGLNAFYLIPTFVFFITARSVRVRVFGIIVTIAAAVFSQSTGIFVAGGIALAAWAVRELWVRRHKILALVVTGVGVAFGPDLVTTALATKAEGSGSSVTDRGIYDAGGRSGASEGNINLLVAWDVAPLAVLLIAAALLVLAVVAIRTSAGTFAVVFFAITAIFSQPSQWQVAAWLMLALALIAAEKRSTMPSSEGRSRAAPVLVGSP